MLCEIGLAISILAIQYIDIELTLIRQGVNIMNYAY
jgi:hypothetical protein